MPYRDPLERARHSRERHQERYQFLAAYKLTVGCLDCGYRHHAAALEFDHIPERGPKRFTLTRGGLGVGWPALLLELEKCEVVCSNCHHIRTVVRRADVPSLECP